jgi:hypothetical protein
MNAARYMFCVKLSIYIVAFDEAQFGYIVGYGLPAG